MRKVALLLYSLAVLMAGGVVLVAPAESARAAFPGKNGKLTFVARPDNSLNLEIYTMNPDGSDTTRLTYNTAADSWRAYDGTPVWTPDGSKIAFQSDRGGYLQVSTP